MTTIKENFAEGGKNMAPSGATGTPTLAQTLRDIADDFTGIKVGQVTSADATDLATCITLVNEIKALINTADAHTLLTQKG